MKKEACPYISSAFELLSKKWSAIILHTLSLNTDNQAHFNDLKSSIASITPRVLSMRLNELADEGLVMKVEASNHHAYQLTEKGLELVQALHDIESWAHKYIEL